MGLTVIEPEVPFAVNPEPTHEVARVEDQVRVDDCPVVMDAGEAERLAVGARLALTVTVALADAEPLAPVQVIE